ncbi:MAG TPA: serine/threonine-protein kinase [Vicinamibacterales bacterium]|nr:serine/threonine-protein kinase [Vicinamibacterales bacterium]
MTGHLIGQYRIEACLGYGGMGVVYHAFDEFLERDVALKILDAAQEDPQKRFRFEAVALARLSHPGIASAYELFQHDGSWGLAMEFVRGRTLEQVLDQNGPLSPQQAADVCMQALLALGHAHARGVVHRDLKPSNLMIGEHGEVKVTDFGIARLAGAVHLTNAGLTMGTPAYMAPEQVRGGNIDARVDLYAMGIVFYRLVTGQLPFKAETPFAMAQSQVNDPPTPIELARADLPGWVHDVVARALVKDPDARFQSAQEFHDALGRGVAGLPAMTRLNVHDVTEQMPIPTTPAAPVRALPHSLAGAWLVAAVAALVLAAAGASLWWRPPVQLLAEGGAPSPSEDLADVVNAAIPTSPPVRETAPSTVMPQSIASKSAIPAVPAPAASTPALMVFRKLKLFVVENGQTKDRDVLLTFSGAELTVVSQNGGTPIAAFPYASISHVTYARASNPQWDPRFASPVGKLDVSGLIARARHWLVVQTTSRYAILRLDGDDWSAVLQTLRARTGAGPQAGTPKK